MPKFKFYIGSSEVCTQTEREIRFVLIGQRDQATEEPTALLEKHSKIIANAPDKEPLTPEESEVLSKFEKARLMNRFGLKVLDWFVSEEEAEAAKVGWPDRVNLEIRPVVVRIP